MSKEKDLTIDEILYGYQVGELDNNQAKREIQAKIDEAVKKETKKLREFTKSLTNDHNNLLKQIPIMIDEAVEAEREVTLKRLRDWLQKEGYPSVFVLANTIIRELGGEEDGN